MYKFGEINFYKDNLNIKDVLKNIDLENSDEALNICDLTAVEQKFNLWKKCLPNIKPYYAVKCNDDALILKTLANLGTGFDCASKNEITQMLDMGVEPERIIFAHPCKPITSLNYAREQKVKTVTVDSECELHKIHKYYPESNILLRFRSEAKDAQYPLGNKFGCDENEAKALLVLAKSLQLKVIGTCFHVGVGVGVDLQAYERAIATAANICKFGKTIGYEMNILDIGGGYPGSNDEKFKLIANIINESLQTHFPDNDIEVIAEPGQFFVAAAYTLICKIITKREIRLDGEMITNMYYVNDGVYGSFTFSIYNPQDVVAQHLLDCGDENLEKFKTIIWGQTCDGVDKITETVKLPSLSSGDFIIFPNMGAYTVTMACKFNGFNLSRIIYFEKLK